MLRQRGFAWLPLVPYLVGALAVAVAFGVTYYKGRVAGREAATAELQPLLDACHGRERALGTQIEAQNAAINSIKALSDAKMKNAEASLKATAKSALVSRNEAERLRNLSGLQNQKSDCPAGIAVQEVRRGLKN